MVKTIDELRAIMEANAVKTAEGSITPTDVFETMRDFLDTFESMKPRPLYYHNVHLGLENTNTTGQRDSNAHLSIYSDSAEPFTLDTIQEWAHGRDHVLATGDANNGEKPVTAVQLINASDKHWRLYYKGTTA